MSLLAVNMVLTLNGTPKTRGANSRERILWLDRATDTAVVIPLDNENAMPIVRRSSELDRACEAGDAVACDDPYGSLANQDSVTANSKHDARLAKLWQSIEKIVGAEPACYDRQQLAPMLTTAVRDFGRKREQIVRDLRRYWQAGRQRKALLPRYDKSGAPGQRRIKDEMRKPGPASILTKEGDFERGLAVTKAIAKLFDAAIKSYLLCSQPLSVQKAYDQLCKDRFSTTRRMPNGRLVTEPLPPDRRPTLRQFSYYYNCTHSPSTRKKSQDGVEAYEQVMRPVLGNSSVDLGPGAVYQIDSTETDVQLVNSVLRERPIGRATRYFTTDAFSGLLTGLHAGLDSPSVLMARLTLANASQSKVAFCERYGIPLDSEELWPSRHLPQSLVADRGELIAKAADALVEELHLKVTNLPAFRPDWKPFVEGLFAHANRDTLHTLRGAVRGKDNRPRHRDSRLDAELDLFAATQILIEFALHYNPTHILTKHPFSAFEIQQGVKPRPLDVWNWGVLHRSGALRVQSDDAIRLLLLEREEAVVTGFGLRFRSAHYDCAEAHEHEWFQKARTRGTWKVKICFDRRNLSFVYLLPEGRRPLIACPILHRDEGRSHLSLEDIDDYDQFLRYRDALMNEEEQSSAVNLRARVGDIVEQQARRTHDRNKAVGPISDNERRNGVKQYRQEEKARQNAGIHRDVQRESKKPSGETEPKAPEPVATPTSLSNYREQRGLDVLRQQRSGNLDDKKPKS